MRMTRVLVLSMLVIIVFVPACSLLPQFGTVTPLESPLTDGTTTSSPTQRWAALLMTPGGLIGIGVGIFILTALVSYTGLRGFQRWIDRRNLRRMERGTDRLPDLPVLKPLDEDSMVHGDTFVVKRLISRSAVANVYAVERTGGIKACPECRALNGGDDQDICASCGLDLASVPVGRQPYLMIESLDQQRFADQLNLSRGHLTHLNVKFPDAVFTESTPVNDRNYMVFSDDRGSLLNSRTMPQPLNQVLAWTEALARGLSYLHEHRILANKINTEQVAESGGHIYLRCLDQFSLFDEAEPNLAARFAEDVRGLAQLMVYLAVGQRVLDRNSGLPGPVLDLFSRVTSNGELTSAAAFADEIHKLRVQLSGGRAFTTRVGSRSDVGKLREINEDSLFIDDIGDGNKPFGVYAVADGVGGHEAGDVASQLTVKTIAAKALDVRQKTQPDIESLDTWLVETARAANHSVHRVRTVQHNDMGSTLVLTCVLANQAMILNVGDSRAYRLMPAGISQITVDHSLVQKLMSMGQITREEARYHPRKSVIYRVIGNQPELEYDLFHHDFVPGEAMLLCSDGLTDMLDDATIWRIWSSSRSPSIAVERMTAAANRKGGVDNITIVIVQFLPVK